MGPESKDCGTFYLDGAPIMTGVIHEITVSEDALTPEAMSLLQPMEVAAHVKMPKSWHCRGRKRFIKLLMSKGISRNLAESVARVARIAGVPYGELWRTYFFWG